ncbi:uncharacterized protein LOC126716163 [Quercus robur]|uniref:uncharacterized protein LOC126716163 n=1 Tax=Quercus robur TaxID=38942 RepID=UPI002161EE90|nr:uncharacterized protein LOC126716163 [Quercus robur]
MHQAAPVTSRALSIDAVARTFTPIWKTRNGFQIRNLGDHKFLFVFDNESDAERVLQNEPWSFDKHLIVFQRFNKDKVLDDYNLNKAALWVQVHNIPLAYMDRETAEEICSTVGKVVQSAGSKETGGGEGFIRVRVIVNVTQPLCRGRVVTLENGTKTWVSFRYERLPNLCYWCGCLDHDDKNCEIWLQSEGSLDQSNKKYDSSIRAKPVFPSSRHVVHVPGYFEGRKKVPEKSVTYRSSGTTAPRHPPISRPSTPVSPEKDSVNPGGNGKAAVNDLPITEDCNPVFGAIPATVDNGQENYREKFKGIDMGMQSVELTEEDVTIVTNETVDPVPDGPNVDPTKVLNKPNIASSKPTKWKRVARPVTFQEESELVVKLGKRFNTTPAETNPIQKRKTSEDTQSYGGDHSTVEAVIQPRREL